MSEQFKVEQSVKCIDKQDRFYGKIGCIVKVDANPDGLPYLVKFPSGQSWEKTNDIELASDVSSPYLSLKSRIEALSGSTTLQEFGELLLEVGEKDTFLGLATNISKDECTINQFYLRRKGEMKYSTDFDSPCDAIPALKKCFMWLLDNHPTIKKDDKQEKIAELEKKLADFTAETQKQIAELKQ